MRRAASERDRTNRSHRRHWTLRRQIAAACLAVAVIPGAVVALVAYRNLRDAAETQAVDEIGTIADLQAERVRTVLERLASTVDEWNPGTIAAQGLGFALVAAGDNGLDEEATELIRTGIERHLSSSPDIRSIKVTDADGVVAFASDPAWIGSRVPAVQLHGGPHLVELDGALHVRDGRAISLEGVHVGHVLIDASLVQIAAVAHDYSSLGETGETSVAMLAGETVRVVSRFRFPSDVPSTIDAGSPLPIAAATRGISSIDAHATDYRGAKVVAATRPILGTPWGVVVKKDRSEVLAGLDDLRDIFVLGAVGTGLVAAAGAWLLSRRLTEPVEHLTETASAIAGGSAVRAQPRGPRELSTLAGTVNAMADALEHQMRADPLTGLPNRVVLEARLAEMVRAVRAGSRQVGVLFCDLDDFKVVNDTRGHGMGDGLLVEVARRLQTAVRSDDLVCRFGGDEFVIVVDDVCDPVDLDARAARIHRAMRAPVALVPGIDVHVSLSIGAAFVTGHDDVETLLGNADSAMYEAKAGGRGQTVVFTHHLRERVEARSATATALQAALTGHELEVHYQPIVDLATGDEVALEALVRWRRDGVIVGPDTFLTVAHQHGLMPRLGDLVLGRVCTDLPSLAPGTLVHVNVSVTELCDPTYVARALSHVRSSGVRPDEICLEVTEEMLLDEVARITLVELREHGFLVAVDDFGTGYSSLAQLRTLPADVLKLDRSLIADVTGSPEDADIVRLVVELGRTLGMVVVAEGVETHEQRDVLAAAGCPRAQGWWHAAAMPLEEVLAAQIDSTWARVPPAGVEPAT